MRYEKLFALRRQIELRLSLAEMYVAMSETMPSCTGGAAAAEQLQEYSAAVEDELKLARVLVDQFGEATHA